MNTGSGTYADFNGYVAANDGGQAFTADDKKGTYGPLTLPESHAHRRRTVRP